MTEAGRPLRPTPPALEQKASEFPSSVAVLNLEGQLEVTSLRASLRKVEESLAGARGLLVDCTKMTGYSADARQAFVAWNKANRGRIRAVAVVTENRLWHVVISAMALASGQSMRGFLDRAEALAWLRS